MNDEDYIQRGAPLHKPLTDKSLGLELYESLEKKGNQEIFIDGVTGEQLTYSQYFQATCQLAVALRNVGVEENDVVGISSENYLKFFQPVLAAFYLGAVIAPINHTYTEGELLHCLNISRPKIIFCSRNVYPKLAALKCSFLERIVLLVKNNDIEYLETFVSKNSMSQGYRNFSPLNHVDTDKHLAAILNSSGTTGLPKGVMITHRNIKASIINGNDPSLIFQKPRKRILSILPFFHAYGFIHTILAIARGDVNIVMSKFVEKQFLQKIQDYKIEVLMIVPPIMTRLVKSNLMGYYDLSSIKSVACGAAPLSKAIEDAFIKHLKINAIRQGYGLTEATLAVTAVPLNKYKRGSSGKVAPGMALKIRDPQTYETLGPYKVGEICAKGPLISRGYYHNSAATQEMFTDDDWLLTGDLAYYDNEGYFYIVDRLKELIKYKGFQVAPAELEALLLKHPKIQDAAVVGKPDADAGELPMALVVKLPGAELTAEEVKKHVSANVSHTKRLRGGVLFVDAIPKNSSGKILRKKMKEIISRLHSKL